MFILKISLVHSHVQSDLSGMVHSHVQSDLSGAFVAKDRLLLLGVYYNIVRYAQLV